MELDPAQYTVVPHVAVVDEFMYQRANGEEVPIDQEFLDDVIKNANTRESETGDLCPIVIGKYTKDGHTKNGLAEPYQPKLIGYARKWTRGRLGKTDRLAAFADFWIKNEHVKEAKEYPRRSAEIWVSRREIDPICLLGATTPERDLGLLPLALSKSEIPLTRPLNEKLQMAEYDADSKQQEGSGKITATPKDADCYALLEKIAAGQSDILAKLDQIAGGSGGGGQDAVTGAPGEPGADMSNEELEKLLAELEAGQGGGEQPIKNSFTTAGGSNTYVPAQEPAKMSKQDQERLEKVEKEAADLRLQLARREVTDRLSKMRDVDGVVIENLDAEVTDILALPADMRPAQLSRIEKNYRRAPIGSTVAPALGATSGTGGNGAISVEERDEIAKCAREEKTDYETAFKKKKGHYPGQAKKA